MDVGGGGSEEDEAASRLMEGLTRGACSRVYPNLE